MMKRIYMIGFLLLPFLGLGWMGKELAQSRLLSSPPYLQHLPEIILPAPAPSVIVLPELQVRGRVPVASTLPRAPKAAWSCHLQSLEQGGSPSHPWVNVCQ